MKKYPSLLTCILISSLLLSLTGAARLKQTNSLTLKEWQKEPLSVTGLKWIVHAFQGSQDNLPEENADASSGSSSSSPVETAGAQADSSSTNQQEGQNGSSTQNPAQSGASSSGLLAGQDHSSSESGRTDGSSDSAAPAPEFITVDASYFDDALFIGDSRTVGLMQYCKELDGHATFYCQQALTIFNLLTREVVKTDHGKISIDQALQERQFGKIYLMIGINEMGTGNDDYFIKHYQAAIERIHALQPNAIIYLEAIMHVTGRKNASDPIFNNTRINRRNERIKALADNVTYFYIDMNEAIDDANGNLRKDLSYDDAHLLGSSFGYWYDFLKTHAIAHE